MSNSRATSQAVLTLDDEFPEYYIPQNLFKHNYRATSTHNKHQQQRTMLSKVSFGKAYLGKGRCKEASLTW